MTLFVTLLSFLLLNLSTKSKKPIGNGIITALNMTQAKKRSKIKGKEAAIAVIEVIKMINIVKNSSPRVKIIQKLYSKVLNPDEKIIYNKSQYKKFIKDVTEGTIERRELIEETIEKFLKEDIDLKRTDQLLKIIIYAAVFELLYKHNNPKKGDYK